MPIVPSRAREIERLIADLESAQAAERQSATARLTLVGERAVDAILRALPRASVRALLCLLDVLEELTPARARDPLLGLFGHPAPEVATRAIVVSARYPQTDVVHAVCAVLQASPPRPLPQRRAAVTALGRLHAAGQIEALGPLVDLLLDESLADTLRLSALAALRRLSKRDLQDIVRPLTTTRSTPLANELRALGLATGPGPLEPEALIRRLETTPPDEEPDLLAALRQSGPAAATALIERLERAPEASAILRLGRALASLGDVALSPAHEALAHTESPLVARILAGALSQIGALASLPVIHDALRRVAASRTPGEDPAWIEARAHLHLALASFGTRLALYDLREMLEARPFLGGATLLRAAAAVGDVSLLAPLVALAHDTPEWASACRETLTALVRRERLRRDARLLRRVRPEHQAVLEDLWPSRRRRP